MKRFALKSKKIVTPNAIVQGYVVINEGKIELVTDNLNQTPECIIIDVGDDVVMPGIIDPHVHINEPGRTDWEGFETATTAALYGGVTLMVDMPLNSSPVTTTVGAFDEKLSAASNKIHTNIGFWGGVVPGNTSEIEGLINKGVLGFKAFLTHSGIDDFPNVTEADLRAAMPIIAKHNLPLLVHCELTDSPSDQESLQNNPTSYQAYLQSRPKQWEDNAIALMIKLCKEYNCRVHIVHLSSENSIAQIEEAKKIGLPLTVETAQHYLYFAAQNIPDGQTAYKCAPPIREESNNQKLWEALKGGIIDFVATDHSPAPPALKCIDTGNLLKAWGGIASIQFALPVLWTAARIRNCSLLDLAKWLCENPAKLIGVKNKGKLVTGYDADIVVLNEKESFIVDESCIQHRHKVTPYLKNELFGVVKQTYLKGNLVFDSQIRQKYQGEIIFRN